MRRGEALALRWEDVDLEAGVLRVRGTLSRVDGELVRTNPKTAKSTREIPVTPGVVALVRSHRDAQAAERTWAESTWEESGFVFATEFGRPIDPRNLFRAFVAAVKRSGVDPEGVGLHTLRHSVATVPPPAATFPHALRRSFTRCDVDLRPSCDCPLSPVIGPGTGQDT